MFRTLTGAAAEEYVKGDIEIESADGTLYEHRGRAFFAAAGGRTIPPSATPPMFPYMFRVKKKVSLICSKNKKTAYAVFFIAENKRTALAVLYIYMSSFAFSERAFITASYTLEGLRRKPSLNLSICIMSEAKSLIPIISSPFSTLLKVM